MNWKDRFLNDFDGKGKVLSALLSVLTLFAVWGKCAPLLYEEIPWYSEWICGLTTWSGYNKQADMLIIQGSLLALPLLFLLFGAIYVWWKRKAEKQGGREGTFFLTSYIALLCMFYMECVSATDWLMLFAVVFAGYCILVIRGETRYFYKILIGTVITMLAVMALILAMSCFSARVGALWQSRSYILPLTAGLVFLAFVLIKPLTEKSGLLLWLQLLLPAGWLGMIHFRYSYEADGSLIELFYSGRWKWMCLLACLILFAAAVAEKLRTSHTILFSTYVMAAVMRVFTQPDGMMSIDYFHNGEIAMPMQQLVSYGKIPYADLIPIHGMCDYYYGLINYLFFDGSYMALGAAKVAGNVLMAAVLAGVIYLFVRGRYRAFFTVYLFMPFFIQTAGMRYWFMILMFFALFSPRIQKGMQSLYAWILLSIAAITWNASIGGAAALAFLPVIIYRLCRDFKGQWRELVLEDNKKRRNLVLSAWGALFLVGIAYIPLFVKIVSYLRENTGTTLYVNGMAMFSDASEVSQYLIPSIAGEQGSFFVKTFAFLIPLLAVFVLIFKKKKNGAGELFVTYLLGFWVLANYSFVRFDEGARAAVLGVFFLILTPIALSARGGEGEKPGNHSLAPVPALCAGMLALALGLAQDSPFITGETLVLEKEIPASVETTIMGETVEDPVLHVSGELVSMPKLGTGFIQGNTLASLENVNTLVRAAEKSGQTVFDITNAVANAVIMDMSLYLPYSSAYNISNDAMQERAIELLEEKLPDIILVAPEIRFDEAPFSYRSMKLYRYIMQADYVPYKYKNVIYLVRGENPLDEGVEDLYAFGQHMHKKDLGYLPAVYAASAEHVSQPLTEAECNVRMTETESGVRIEFEEAVSGSEIAFIGISGLSLSEDNRKADDEKETLVTLKMENADICGEEPVEFRFALRGEEYLIPAASSPLFYLNEELKYIELTSETPEDVSWDEIEVHFYQ